MSIKTTNYSKHLAELNLGQKMHQAAQFVQISQSSPLHPPHAFYVCKYVILTAHFPHKLFLSLSYYPPHPLFLFFFFLFSLSLVFVVLLIFIVSLPCYTVVLCLQRLKCQSPDWPDLASVSCQIFSVQRRWETFFSFKQIALPADFPPTSEWHILHSGHRWFCHVSAVSIRRERCQENDTSLKTEDAV